MNRFAYLVCCFPILFLISIITARPIQAQNTYRLEKAPFYKTFNKKAQTGEARIAHLPVLVDYKTQEEFFYTDRQQALQPLINVINGYLDNLQWSPTLSQDSISTLAKDFPALFVGSAESVIAPPSAEMLREEFDKFPPMVMHIDKPSKNWRSALSRQLEQADADFVLIFWIGFNEYPKANKGLFKKKVVLGTGYEPEIRFLSAELEPVEVLQLSGMLLNKEGQIVRAGAEAFLYEDSPFWVQVLGAETVIKESTLEQAPQKVLREDLPQTPPAWKVAAYHLLQQLTRRPQNFSSSALQN